MSDDPAIQLIGHQWARDAHAIKDFLGRNEIAFTWLDLDRGRAAADALATRGLSEATLPVVVLPDGTTLEDPPVEVLADALGMHTTADQQYYDVAIVGGGPAGLAAAVYGASEGLSTLLVEREAPGGQAGTSSRIENYLGFPTGISGADLASRALTQARRLGAEIVFPKEVTAVEIGPRFKTLTLNDGEIIVVHALVVATGVSYRALSAPGLAELAGAGVYYGAATTEALAAEGRDVFVVGSGNSAGQGALYFAKFARSVTILIRGESLAAHMSQYLIDQIDESDIITVRPQHQVKEAQGDQHLERLVLADLAADTTETVDAEFLFIFIGAEPTNAWLGGAVATDEQGYILTGPDVLDADTSWPLERGPFHLEASVPGVFAAGDVRHGSIRRVAGGVGEGSTCIQLVHRYLAAEA
ncbi:MAG: FAD-dependent oxidoreductase [Acidimicrobiia bacterium]|nr:FAD-dependent oxidoreductase [Acidimicrobiia bacterium]